MNKVPVVSPSSKNLLWPGFEFKNILEVLFISSFSTSYGKFPKSDAESVILF